MGFFSKIGDAFKSVGQKIGQGASYLGKKALQGLDYGIQGAKIATDFVDKYTLGLDHFIPYYSAIKAGIDIADDVRKIAKGEEKFGWETGARMGGNLLMGAIGASSAKAELQGLKEGANIFKGARATGSGMREAVKLGGGRVLRGYGFHPEQIRQGLQSAGQGVKNIAGGLRRGEVGAYAKTGVGLGAIAGYAELQNNINQERRQNAISQNNISNTTVVPHPSSTNIPTQDPVSLPVRTLPSQTPPQHFLESGIPIDYM